MQVTRARSVVAILAGIVLGGTGCDDYHTGDPSDPDGPLLLVRVMVQDSPQDVSTAIAAGGTTRGGAVDLLDTDAPVACSDNAPCRVLMAYEGGLADFTCRNGTCNDPLAVAVTGVPVNPDVQPIPAMPPMPAMPAMGCTPATPATPEMPAVPGVPGMAVRLVFNKLVDVSKITSDGMQLLPGVVDFIDEGSGMPFDFTMLGGYYDLQGDALYTSDPLIAPFGPAVQITPLGMQHNAKYSVVIHPGLLHDRKGNPLADKTGKPITGDLKLTFTTENIGVNPNVGSFTAATPYTLVGDFTPQLDSLPSISASDVLQFAFYSNMDPTTFMFTLTGPNGAVTTAEAYLDNPKDPAAGTCTSPSMTQIDLAFTSAPGKPAPWPVGKYTLSFTVNSMDAGTTTFSSKSWPGADANGNLTFQVVAPASGASAATDANIVDLHPLPEQSCPCM
jgi:hypothetical protein